MEEQSKWTLTCSGVWSMDELDAPGLRVPTRNRGRPAGDLVAVDLVAVFAMEPAGLWGEDTSKPYFHWGFGGFLL